MKYRAFALKADFIFLMPQEGGEGVPFPAESVIDFDSEAEYAPFRRDLSAFESTGHARVEALNEETGKYERVSARELRFALDEQIAAEKDRAKSGAPVSAPPPEGEESGAPVAPKAPRTPRRGSKPKGA